MTRLTTEDLAPLLNGWPAYARRLRDGLGVDLTALGARAAGRPPQVIAERLRGRRLAAVSSAAGQGVLPGFAETLALIGRAMGLESAAMPSPDEAGQREAAAWGAELVIGADDDRFTVRVLADGREADNAAATGRAFTAALELMAGGTLAGREVLVLGLGPVGRSAARSLAAAGAWPILYDPDPARGPEALASAGAGELASGPDGLAEVLARRTRLIFEAVPQAEALPAGLVAALARGGPGRTALVAAPGVPLSWPSAWLAPGGPARLWHDVLPSGAAAMLALAVA